MIQARVILDLLLEGRARGEEAGPVGVVLTSVWHEVMVSNNWPLYLLFLECVNILGGGGVDEGHVGVLVAVAVLDEGVDLLVHRVLVRSSEVVSHEDDHVLLPHLDVRHSVRVVLQLRASLVKIKSHLPLIHDNIILIIVLVREGGWWRVVPEEHLGEDLLLGAVEVAEWLPKEDGPLSVLQLLSFVRAHSREEHGIEAEIGEEGRVGLRMAEGIQHPSDLWLDSKLLIKEPMPHMHIQDQILIIWACLIGCGPAALGDF